MNACEAAPDLVWKAGEGGPEEGKKEVGKGVIYAEGAACAKAPRQQKHHVSREVKAIVMELVHAAEIIFSLLFPLTPGISPSL